MRLRVRSVVMAAVVAVGTIVVGGIPAAAAQFTVTKTADTADGSCNADCSLREAVDAANATGGPDEVVLPAGTYTLTRTGGDENLNDSGDLDISESLTISGAVSATTIIHQAVSGQRVLHATAPGTNLTLSGVTIEGGNTFSLGGAISSDNDVTLTDTTFTDNNSMLSGGAVYAGGDVTATRVTFSGSDSGSLGGAISSDNDVSLTDTTFTDNNATSSGGAIYLGGNVTATNLTMSGNHSKVNGGGISADGSFVRVSNGTIVGNTADSDGNGSGQGGGLWVGAPSSITNTILSGNLDLSPVTKAPDCLGPVTSGGYTILGTTEGCTYTPGTEDKIGVDPLLAPVADNGGPVPTQALLPGSPALDAGNPVPAGSGGSACAAADARGVPRSLGGRCDIGAYELVFCQGTVVNRVGTPGDDTLIGTDGPDGFLGFEGKDRLVGGKGNDRLCAGPGKDTLKGGSGKDRLRGEAQKDTLRGGGGNDRMAGGPGGDVCIGGGGKKDKGISCKTERGIP